VAPLRYRRLTAAELRTGHEHARRERGRAPIEEHQHTREQDQSGDHKKADTENAFIEGRSMTIRPGRAEKLGCGGG
jgi:hypothetical protein